VRLYWEVARRSFRRWSTYRAATVAGVFTNTVFGYLRAYILIAVVVAAGGRAGGWDQTELVTFAFVTQGLINVSQAFGDPELAERVRTGDVVVDLYRPVDLQLWWMSASLGRAAFTTLARGIPPVMLGAVVFDLRFTTSPWMWVAGLVSVLLATLAGFAFRFLVNLTTFWTLDQRGLDQLATLALSFFSGLLLPIVLFPSWLEQIARLLPFAAMIQTPAEVLMGVRSGGGVVGLILHQLVWVVALLVAGRVMLARADRRVVIQGG
jgi:ABC-2 type transport system permease protein